MRQQLLFTTTTLFMKSLPAHSGHARTGNDNDPEPSAHALPARAAALKGQGDRTQWPSCLSLVFIFGAELSGWGPGCTSDQELLAA